MNAAQHHKAYIKKLAKDGQKCAWIQKNAKDMNRTELLAFIGMLNQWATHLADQLISVKQVVSEELKKITLSRGQA